MCRCAKLLQHKWTALYSAAGQGLYMQFTRPFPLAEVGLACETRNDDRDAEEFLQARFYFGKSATGFRSLKADKPSPHSREGFFCPEKM